MAWVETGSSQSDTRVYRRFYQMNVGDLVSFDLPYITGMVPDRGVILSINRDLSYVDEEIQVMTNSGLMVYISDLDFKFYCVEVISACG